MKKTISILALVALLVAAVFSTACSSKIELTAPQNVTYDGVYIKWDPVVPVSEEGEEDAEELDLAITYTVTINDGEAKQVRTTQLAYKANNETFTVTIVASSDADTVVEPSETTIEFKPLPTVGDITITADGIATWDAVEGATGYVVQIDGKTQEGYVAVNSYDQLPGGTHSIAVRAIVIEDSSYYSCWSVAKSVTVLNTIDKKDVTYVDGVIKWPYVSGATGYEVKINDQVVETKYSGTQLIYNADNTNFSVSIKALGNGTSVFDSKYSEVKNFIFLAPVTNIRVEDGILLWDTVEHADGYRIKINGQELSALTDAKFENLQSGKQQNVEIMPTSTAGEYFASWSAVKSVLLLNAPVLKWNNYAVDGGTEAPKNAYWDGVDGAAGYVVRVTTPEGKVETATFADTERAFAHAYNLVGKYTVEVKAVSPADSNTISDSKYSLPVTVERLAAPTKTANYLVSDPQNVKEGFTVSYQIVSGATKYRLIKDGVTIKEVTGTQMKVGYADFMSESTIDEQTLNFKVQSVGQPARNYNGGLYVVLDSLSAETLSFEIKVLATPAAPTISGFTYTFGTVNGNNGYAVSIGDKAIHNDTASYDLSTLEAGGFDVKVCARGNGSNVLASNYTSAIRVVRLEAPRDVKISTQDNNEGQLIFTGVDHAVSYEAILNNEGLETAVNVTDNFNDKISTKGTTLYMRSIANVFNQEGTVYYMTSKAGKTYNFIKFDQPTFGEVRVQGNQLVWNAPFNVDSAVYTPVYEIYDQNETKLEGLKNGTSFDISALPGGSYTFKVKAIGGVGRDGTNYINSDMSLDITIQKLDTPTVRTEGGKYVWDPVFNATNYAVFVDGKEVYKGNADLFYTPAFTQQKTYTVEIKAIGDGGILTADSNPYTIEQQTAQLIKPEFTVGYSEEAFSTTGEIIVTITGPVAFAKGYAINIGDNSGILEEGEFEYRFNPHTTGKYEVKVYARGGNFNEDGSVYYLDSQMQYTQTITLLGKPNMSSIKFTGMNGMLTWSSVTGAVGYEISIDGSDWISVTSGKLQYATGFTYGSGISHTISVRAVGNGSTVITSETVTVELVY